MSENNKDGKTYPEKLQRVDHSNLTGKENTININFSDIFIIFVTGIRTIDFRFVLFKINDFSLCYT